MKRVISVIAAVMMLVMMLSLAACSEANVQPTTAPAASTEAPAAPTEAPTEGNTLAGSYTMISMTNSGQTFDKDTLVALGISTTLEVRDDNTATFTMTSGGETQTQELKIDTEAKTFTPTEGGTTVHYTQDGTNLTLEENGTSMEFEKQ